MKVPIADAAHAPYCFVFGLMTDTLTRLLPVTEQYRQLFADQSNFHNYQA